MNLSKTILFSIIILLFAFTACKKNEIVTNEINIQNPLLRKDAKFPNGILQFNSTASFKVFWDKVTDDPTYVSKNVNGFKSFRDKLNEYNSTKSSQSSQIASSSTSSNSSSIIEVDTTEFLFDLNEYCLPVENLATVVNDDMEVIVENTLYQFTRIGLFKVDLTKLDSYATFFDANVDNIYYDSSFVSIPNEVPIGNNEYQVLPGIVRQEDATNDILANRVQYIEDGGGFLDNGGGGGGNGSPTPSNNYYVNSTVGESFNKEVGIIFNDWAKRRLLFKTQKTNISLFGWGFHKIDIKAKIQREKKFLWFTYWGPSFADEIIVGCDNMDLETDYIFPHPQQFSTMYRPTFEGLANFTIGNHVLQTMNIKVNLSALNYSLTNTEVSSYINSAFNSVVGNVYNDAFKLMETKIINSIDASYLSTYANYTKKINRLNEDNRLKWVIGKAEKPEGYSHANEWIFDWNIGGTYQENGGIGGYPLQYHYNYSMKAGSFFRRARVGNIWHGIRIVRI